MNRIINLFCLLGIAIFNNISGLNAQQTEEDKNVYYDFELEYLPKVISCSDEFLFCYIDSDIGDAIENVISRNDNVKSNVSKFAGRTIKSSGIVPKQLINKTWSAIELNETGEIQLLEIYPKTEKNEELSRLLFKSLNKCKILPGLKENNPVKCRLYFTIEIKEMISNK